MNNNVSIVCCVIPKVRCQVVCRHPCCCTGAESKMYILYVTVLLSARLQAVHDTAKLDLLQNVSGSENQQVWYDAISLP